jgi:hypothetical protein
MEIACASIPIAVEYRKNQVLEVTMPQYWMTMIDPPNFEIDRKANFAFTGYKERIKKTSSKAKVGDKLVY